MTDHFEAECINFVPRQDSPPNVQEGLILGYSERLGVREELACGKYPKTRILFKISLKKIDTVTVKALFESNRGEVGEVGANGVIESNWYNIKRG